MNKPLLSKNDDVWSHIDKACEDESDVTVKQLIDLLLDAAEDIDPDAPCPRADERLSSWEEDAPEYDWRGLWVERARERASNVVAIRPTRSKARREGSNFINDAEFLGKTRPKMEKLLNSPAVMLTGVTGEVWGAKDRRNTLDCQWNQVERTWGDWIGGGEKPTWGFSRHPEGKHKAGACVVLGSSVGGARTARAMETLYAVGLDIDSGIKLDDVLDILEERVLFAMVYTTHSHGKSGLQIKRDDVLKNLKLDRDPTLEEVKKYLRAHSKSHYTSDFIESVTIRKPKHQTKNGVVIDLDSDRPDKFRVIIPLSEPVQLMELADTEAECLAVWEDKVVGLAQNSLGGIPVDTSATDPSRLFYLPRHPKDAEDRYCAVVQGKPLSFDDVKLMKKSAYTSKRESNPFLEASGDDGGGRPPQCHTPSGRSLNNWHRKAKSRFLLADLIEDACSDMVRVAGGEATGHVHTVCPWEDDQSSEGGTATMAVDSIDSEKGYWTHFCHHDSCQGRHKLEFLEKMLADAWFEEELLYDDRFLLPTDDDEGDSDFDAARAGPLKLRRRRTLTLRSPS